MPAALIACVAGPIRLRILAKTAKGMESAGSVCARFSNLFALSTLGETRQGTRAAAMRSREGVFAAADLKARKSSEVLHRRSELFSSAACRAPGSCHDP